jgi:hypothetical protein
VATRRRRRRSKFFAQLYEGMIMEWTVIGIHWLRDLITLWALWSQKPFIAHGVRPGIRNA